MKSFFRRLFLENWIRKLISVVLAIVIWFVTNQTLTSTRIISNIPVRVVHVPAGKTVEGMQNNGLLNKRISLTLVGNKTFLDGLTSNDLEVLIDANDKPDEWIASVSKNNLVSLNPEIEISTGVMRVSHPSFTIHLTKLVTEKIPIIITRPIGEAPRDYLFLDVWPYHLTVKITGPEDVVKRLKASGLTLTFNLNEITKGELDALSAGNNASTKDVVSFFVPNAWKQLSIPAISDTPVEIDDPQAKSLRIDFVRFDLLPIEQPVPVRLFFPPEFSDEFNPGNTRLVQNQLVKRTNDLFMLTPQLFAKGVSRLFVEVVRDMIEMVVIVSPHTQRQSLDWSIQFINPRLLEDRYVSILLADASDDEVRHMQPSAREEYLRNRFRSYMSRFQFFKAGDTKWDFKITLEDHQVVVNEK